jgi:Glycosyl hydrolase family 47
LVINFSNQDKNVKFFETVIRYLGGLLSSYALTHNPVLLLRADDLGHRLLPAFNTPSGSLLRQSSLVSIDEIFDRGCPLVVVSQKSHAKWLASFYPRLPAVKWNTDTSDISPAGLNT